MQRLNSGMSNSTKSTLLYFLLNHLIKIKLYFIQLNIFLYQLKNRDYSYIPWNIHWPTNNTKEQRFVLCSAFSSRQKISNPQLLLDLNTLNLWIRNNDRKLLNINSLPPREGNEQKLEKFIRRGNASNLWNLLWKFKHWNFNKGVMKIFIWQDVQYL